MKFFKALYAVLAVAVISVIFITAGVSFAGLNDGLVAYYPFNGNANDESGNGNNGTVYGATLTTDRCGDTNSAYSFNGMGDNLIRVPNSPSLNFGTGDFSIAFWISTGAGDEIISTIIDKRTANPDGETNALGYSVHHSYGNIGVQLATSIPSYDSYTNYGGNIANIGTNTWKFVVVSIDRDQDIGGKIYVDGLIVQTYNPTDRTYSIDNNSDLIIGENALIPTYTFEGNVDDIRIYNRALSESEIQELYKLGTNQNGWLQVNISPSDAVAAGAQWCVNGTCYNSGYKAELTPGTYTVEFKTVSGWTKPANQSVTVTGGQTKAVSGVYTYATSPKGYLQVTITPQDAVTAGSQWCVSGACYSSGTKTELSAGTYTVEFKTVSGWTKPANQSVTVVSGETKTVTGTYTKISTEKGFLTIDDATGSSGAKDVSVVISLDNSKLATPVAAFELRIRYNALTGIHANTKYTLTSRTTGFTGSVTVTENGENSEAHVLLYNTSGGTVPSGTGAIFNLLFDVDSTATFGKTSNLSFTECLVSDSAGKQIPSDCSDTAIFTIGSSCEPLGDINKDGKYNIFDLQLLINCILAKGTCDCCDLNADTKYNIFDIQTLINKILKPAAARSREIRSSSNTLTFPSLELAQNDTGTFGLNLANQDAVSAAQIEFTYDSAIGFEITEAKLTARSQGFTVTMTPDKTDPENVKAVILLYNMSGGVISAGSGDILELAYNTTAGSGTTALSFAETLLSDKDAKPLSVTAQNGTASFDGGVLTLGDVNGDGKLDLKDAVYILQVITGIR